MADEEKIGQRLHREALKGKRSGDDLLDSMLKDLEKINKSISSKAKRLYNSVFQRLELDKSGFVINSVDNLALVSMITNGLDPITAEYRMLYGDLIRSYREETFVAIGERENRISRALLELDGESNRAGLTDEAFKLISALNERGFRRINTLLINWKEKVYDLFMGGVAKELDIMSFREVFFNKDGSVKVGSSLEEETTAEAMQAVTEQRTAFMQQKARENGYTYCWNSNPMDQRTKPECIMASIAGVIPESEMGTVYGFPPRYICRCELIYTRPEWMNVNRGINAAIAERRVKLIDELINAPRQKSVWLWRDKKIYPKEASRRAGQKMYQETRDKLDLIMATQVPAYDVRARAVIEELLGKGATMEDIRRFRDTYFLRDVSDQRIKRIIDGCYL